MAEEKVIAGDLKTLLIIDDSDFIRERLVAVFEECKNIGTIKQAKDSFEAMELFVSTKPDVIILDIHIPGDNGIKLLEKFKNIRPEVKIIMLTNYPYEHYKKKCMELGADLFFEKSADMNEIVDLLDAYCPNH